MKVFVKGKGEVTLTQKDFVAQGGQAAVYQRLGSAYKVYLDPKKAIPEAKFRELEPIDDPSVIRPEELLLEPKTMQTVGYTMRFLPNTYSLCQLFPKVFRQRHGLSSKRVHELVTELQVHIERVHKAGVVVVDLNELNILVDQSFSGLYLIDVDSFQTKSFRAEVIMPSVRDWSVPPKDFDELSDWFSFAVLAFQLYVGIHPYRGTHPETISLPSAERLERRMRQHISAFNRDVKLPGACDRPESAIPEPQRSWLEAVLEHGKRMRPPSPGAPAPLVASTQAVAPRAAFAEAGVLTVSMVIDIGIDILGYSEWGPDRLLLSSDGIRITRTGSGPRVAVTPPRVHTLVGFTPKLGRPVALWLEHESLYFASLDTRQAKVQKIALFGEEIATSGGRFYVRSQGSIYELEVMDLADDLVVKHRPVAQVLKSATRLFDGCAIQSMLGSVFVSIFARRHAGYQVRIPELDEYKVVEARYVGPPAEGDPGVLMVIGSTGTRYDRLVFRFDASFLVYDMQRVEDISPSGLNFLVTDSRICILLNEDEKLEAFPTEPGKAGRRIVEDPALSADMRLTMVSGRPGFTQGSKLYTMALK